MKFVFASDSIFMGHIRNDVSLNFILFIQEWWANYSIYPVVLCILIQKYLNGS